MKTTMRLPARIFAFASLLGLCACAGAAATPVAPEPVLTPQAGLERLTVLAPLPAQITFTDSDCAKEKAFLSVNHAELLTGALAKAGFTVVTGGAYDIKATLVEEYNYCGAAGFEGSLTLRLEPGSSFVYRVSRMKDGYYKNGWDKAISQLTMQVQHSPITESLLAQKTNGGLPTATVAAGVVPTPSNARGGAGFAAGTRQGNAYALVIGVEKYRDVPAPAAARADAETFRDLAKRTFGVPEANVRLLLDDRAGRSDIQRELNWLRANVPSGGRIYFFFAGHGSPDTSDGTPYLLPYDVTLSDVKSGGMPLQHVLSELSSSKASEVIAFVDACFSGAGGRSVLPVGARPLVRVKDATAETRVALFSAASGSQISGSTADGKAGLFTATLAQGLGRAEADLDGDGTITLAELAQWASPRVAREAQRLNRDQKPGLTLGRGANAQTIGVASGVAKP